MRTRKADPLNWGAVSERGKAPHIYNYLTLAVQQKLATCTSGDANRAWRENGHMIRYGWIWSKGQSEAEQSTHLDPNEQGSTPVSYTHLTLPTIYSV